MFLFWKLYVVITFYLLYLFLDEHRARESYYVDACMSMDQMEQISIVPGNTTFSDHLQ